jgi:hypothetical protein
VVFTTSTKQVKIDDDRTFSILTGDFDLGHRFSFIDYALMGNHIDIEIYFRNKYESEAELSDNKVIFEISFTTTLSN